MPKVYSQYTVRFDGRPDFLVQASSPESAIRCAMDYENGSFSRLYAGRPEVTLNDLLSVSWLPPQGFEVPVAEETEELSDEDVLLALQLKRRHSVGIDKTIELMDFNEADVIPLFSPEEGRVLPPGFDFSRLPLSDEEFDKVGHPLFV